MESIVNQALGNIIDTDAHLLFDRSNIENTFMGDTTVSAGIEHFIMFLQTIGHIVGIEYRYLRGLFEPSSTHHTDIHPCNRQNTGTSIGRRRDLCALSLTSGSFPRQEGSQMFTHTYRPHTRATTTMGDTKCFVQVEMRDITAKLARLTDTNHRIEIGSIDIHLTTMGMHNIADLGNMFFKYTMC